MIVQHLLVFCISSCGLCVYSTYVSLYATVQTHWLVIVQTWLAILQQWLVIVQHMHVCVALEGSMLAWSCYYVSKDLSCSCVAEIYSQRVFLVNICVTIFCPIFTRMLLWINSQPRQHFLVNSCLWSNRYGGRVLSLLSAHLNVIGPFGYDWATLHWPLSPRSETEWSAAPLCFHLWRLWSIRLS